MAESGGKLCFVLGNYWGQCMGGAELQAGYLEEEALRQGWQTHYCFLSNGQPVAGNPGTELYPIPQKRLWSRLGNVKYPYAADLLRALDRIRPDVIYQRAGFAFTGITASWARKNGRRLVFHIAHDLDVQRRPPPWRRPFLLPEILLMRQGIRKADLVVAQTRFQAEQLQKHYGREAVVIPNGHPVPADSEKPAGPVVVAWVANWKAIKQPEIFVRLAEEVSSENIRFAMFGRIDNYGELARRARALGVEVMGEVSNERVNDSLASSHLLVNTSRHEGFSNTFIQAWLRRVPVVSLQVDPDEVLSRQGIGCCSGSFGRLAADVRRLATDREQLDTMGARAREYAVANHSLDNMKRLLLKCGSLLDRSETTDCGPRGKR
ncbi:MAG: glycosyltransferase family 4 protein [Thermodesulfobacteriota bacterium]